MLLMLRDIHAIIQENTTTTSLGKIKTDAITVIADYDTSEKV